MWLSSVMFHYGLCHMNIQEVPTVLPNLLKGQGVCYHVYVIGAHKRTHVDHWNMPNHCTSIYHKWMCVCVAALKVIVTRYTAQSVMQTCMLPRELIWERVTSSHTGVTQNIGWPSLQLLWSTPEKAVFNVVRYIKCKFKFKFSSSVLKRAPQTQRGKYLFANISLSTVILV